MSFQKHFKFLNVYTPFLFSSETLFGEKKRYIYEYKYIYIYIYIYRERERERVKKMRGWTTSGVKR